MHTTNPAPLPGSVQTLIAQLAKKAAQMNLDGTLERTLSDEPDKPPVTTKRQPPESSRTG